MPACQPPPVPQLEDQLLKRVRAFAHVDDPHARSGLSRRSSPTTLRRTTSSLRREQRLARMLFFSLWSDGGGYASYADGLDALRRERATRANSRAVVDLSFDAARHLTLDLRGRPGRRAAEGARPLPARRDPWLHWTSHAPQQLP